MSSAQKNPQAIRLAEERRGLEQLTMSAAVNLSRAWQLSSHIHNMCSEAREAIYTREADVKHWLDKGQWSSCLGLSLAAFPPQKLSFWRNSVRVHCRVWGSMLPDLLKETSNQVCGKNPERSHLALRGGEKPKTGLLINLYYNFTDLLSISKNLENAGPCHFYIFLSYLETTWTKPSGQQNMRNE